MGEDSAIALGEGRHQRGHTYAKAGREEKRGDGRPRMYWRARRQSAGQAGAPTAWVPDLREAREAAGARPPSRAYPDPLLFPTLSDWAASSPLYNSGEISIGVLNDPVDAKKLGGAIEHTRAPYILMRGRAKRAPESWRGRDGRAMAVRRQMGLRGIQNEGSEPTARCCGAARRTCTSYVRPGAQDATD